LTKVEGLDAEIIDDLIAQVTTAAPKKTPVFAISSQSGQGLQRLLFSVKDSVAAVRAKAAKASKTGQKGLPVIKLEVARDGWRVKKSGKRFIITGEKIEHFAVRTDFDNDHAVQRLRDIMKKMGILHELTRRGIKADQIIQIGADEAASFPY
jgi:GTP-binding protein